MVSLVNEMNDGTVEIATIGNEGKVGTPLLLRTTSLPARTFVQMAGHGYRVPAETLLRAIRESPRADRLFYRYVQTLFEHVSQWVACNRLHTLEARCARWLLMTRDRAGADAAAADARDVRLTFRRTARRQGAPRRSWGSHPTPATSDRSRREIPDTPCDRQYRRVSRVPTSGLNHQDARRQGPVSFRQT